MERTQRYLAEETSPEVACPALAFNTMEQQIEPQKPEDRVRELERAVGALKKREGRLQGMLDDRAFFVREVVDMLPTLRTPKPYKARRLARQTKEQVAVAMLSDAQIGECILPEETGGLGEYNIKIFEQRLRTNFEALVRVVELHRKVSPIRKLVIPLLGDIIDGHNIYKGHNANLELNAVDQLLQGVVLIAQYILSLSAHFEEIELVCIPGNHGRIGEGEKFHVNWEYIFYCLLEEKLRDHKQIKFIRPKAWWAIHNILGWNFFMVHGDDINRYFGIPWYGTEKAAGRWATMFKDMDTSFQYILMGHHHTPFSWDLQAGLEVFCNGTFVQGNIYAAKKLQLRGEPTQWLFFVHPEHGVAARYKLRLKGFTD